MRVNKDIVKVIAFMKEKKGLYTRSELAEKFDVPYPTISKVIKREGLQDYVSSTKNVSRLRGGEVGQVQEHKFLVQWWALPECNLKDLKGEEFDYWEEKFVFYRKYNQWRLYDFDNERVVIDN